MPSKSFRFSGILYKCFVSNTKNQVGALMVDKSMMAKIGAHRLQWPHRQVLGVVTQAAELAQLRGQQADGKYYSKT